MFNIKTTITLLLLRFLFCENDNNLYYLKKYSRITLKKESGIFYLEDFDINDSIHLHFCAKNGRIDTVISYDFSDSLPDSTTFYPKYKVEASHTEEEESEESGLDAVHYHFNFKKEIDKKYILIKYDGFHGSILYIDNLIVSYTVMIICIFSFIGLCCLGKIILMIINNRARKMAENNPKEKLTNGYKS